jgi:hypothetical protein
MELLLRRTQNEFVPAHGSRLAQVVFFGLAFTAIMCRFCTADHSVAVTRHAITLGVLSLGLGALAASGVCTGCLIYDGYLLVYQRVYNVEKEKIKYLRGLQVRFARSTRMGRHIRSGIDGYDPETELGGADVQVETTASLSQDRSLV